MEDLIRKQLKESIEVKEKVITELTPQIAKASQLIIDGLKKGGKIVLFGNGGSAADAQHFACEMVGRYQRERSSIPAIALTADSSVLTALSNDYGYERSFSRQVEAVANSGDVVVAISTSGNSANVLAAVRMARQKECRTIGLTGKEGGQLAGEVDVAIQVPSEETPRIQEAHIAIIHVICYLVEEKLFGER